MAVCDSEPLSPTSSFHATSAQQTLNAELNSLKLKEKPEEESDSIAAEENDDPAGKKMESLSEEKPQEEVSDGCGSDRENEKLEKDLEPQYSEVVADGWGWDQDFSAPEGNQELVKYPELSNEEKEESWGWDQENGGTEENVKSDKHAENWREEKRQMNRSMFPLRPNEPDCGFYVKTGMCRFGPNCRFNHPPSKMKNMMAYKEQNRGTLSESNGLMDCKYYPMPGGCKYGNACKYIHKEKTEVPAELNFLGLPKRPGEKECTFYMSTGSCKYSINCRFHHPDPIAVGGLDPSPGYQNGGSSQPHVPPGHIPMISWPLERAPTEPVPFLETSPPYVSGYFLPARGLHPTPKWNGYQVPGNRLFPAEINMTHPPSAYAMDGFNHKGSVSAPKRVPDGDYPERPGQPECQFFMKNGTCKFMSACKFHHPKSRLAKTSDINANPAGLPIRPDQPVCTHYSRYGVCKFGQSCRYNHPMDCNPMVCSASIVESESISREQCRITGC